MSANGGTVRVAGPDPFDPRGLDGYCGFCGAGNGHLGDQGDDSSEFLPSFVRTGVPGRYKFASHPNACESDRQWISWCGSCTDGLAHKFQRLDNRNLEAVLASSELLLSLDPIRWDAWDALPGPEFDEAVARSDDPSVHAGKLVTEREIILIRRELARRSDARHALR